MNALYCGLDVHKESTYATIINAFGEVQTQKRMKNDEIPRFLEPFQLEKVAMEASTYIMPLHRKPAERLRHNRQPSQEDKTHSRVKDQKR